jgi:hypothetical protein
MARAPSNPQRNIECQGVAGVQELQESKGRLQVRPRCSIRKDSRSFKFQIYDPVTSTPIL